MLGDRTLFTNADGIENLLGGVRPTPGDRPPLHRYAPVSYGPQKMHELNAPWRWWLAET
jgi:glucose-6-phosphate 1-dehydrogenase